jgi:YfdX protein
MNLSAAKSMLVSAFLLVPSPAWPLTPWHGSMEEPVWQPASNWDTSTGLFRAGSVPGDYNPLLLTLGRMVYADLQRARQAALHKQPTNLTVALDEARDTVHRLRLPTGVMALDAQLQVIRNDLHDTAKHPDESLWVPVDAEISRVLVYAPDEVGNRVREALRTGRSAAGQGDTETAEGQLNVVASSMQYSLGMFPLNKVRTDLNAALTSATELPGPDWNGALDAVQDALATFHWYTQRPAFDLLAAYDDVLSAYNLARGMYAHPEQWRRVSEYLRRAQHRLEVTPDGWGLARLAGESIYRVELQRNDAGSSIKYLLNALQSHIQQQRQQARDRYRKSAA